MTVPAKRLLKEWKQLQKGVHTGSSIGSEGTMADVVDLRPTDGTGENLLEWSALLRGPASGNYAGGLFEVSISVPTTYPQKPPKMRFVTRIWHPNVSWKVRIEEVDVCELTWRSTPDGRDLPGCAAESMDTSLDSAVPVLGGAGPAGRARARFAAKCGCGQRPSCIRSSSLPLCLPDVHATLRCGGPVTPNHSLDFQRAVGQDGCNYDHDSISRLQRPAVPAKDNNVVTACSGQITVNKAIDCLRSKLCAPAGAWRPEHILKRCAS